MKLIPLNLGKKALVDDEDYPWLAENNWFTSRGKWAPVVRFMQIKYKKHSICMHHVVMNSGLGEMIDHIDGNRLNNQKSNLRFCTNTENCRNQKVQTRPKTSKFKGVNLIKATGRWRATLKFNKKFFHLGTFASQSDAANEYDWAATKYFGAFAKTNASMGLL